MTTEQPQLECGATLDELSEYLESGRTPPIERFESCPECLNALDSLEKASRLSRELLESDAASLPEPSRAWFDDIRDTIVRELRPGRELPLRHPDPRVDLSISEGAVHAVLRATGDAVAGVFVAHTELVGDVETPGAPIRVELTASIAWPSDVRGIAEQLRTAVFAALDRHTELRVVAVDITVADVHGIWPGVSGGGHGTGAVPDAGVPGIGAHEAQEIGAGFDHPGPRRADPNSTSPNSTGPNHTGPQHAGPNDAQPHDREGRER